MEWRQFILNYLRKPEPLIDCEVPAECSNCRWCGQKCMEAEAIDNDWFGRGRIIRIMSTCDESDERAHFEMPPELSDKDYVRTEFLPEREAIAAWNEMQKQ